MHKKIRLNAAAKAGRLIILFFLIIAVFAPVIAPYDPKEMIASYLPPSKEHILGTNDVGQDIFSEMVYGTRVSLYIGIFAAFIVTGVGTVLALVSGYFGGVAPDHRDQHHGLDRYGANLKSPGHAAERTAFHQDRKDDGRSPGGDPFQTHSAEY